MVNLTKVSEALVKTETKPADLNQDIITSLVLNGDLSKMQPAQKVLYYKQLCERLGLDPTTQPFKLLRLNGKEILYADKGATQQLSQNYHISHEVLNRDRVDDVYVVTVRARTPDGRYTDEDGAVSIGALKGDALANAIMKAVTKAKRRAVLAMCGLGMMDEEEIETITDLQTEPVKISVPAEPVQDPKPAANTAAVWKIPANMRKAFDGIRKRIGEEKFLNALGACGYENLDQIPDIKEANKILAEISKQNTEG